MTAALPAEARRDPASDRALLGAGGRRVVVGWAALMGVSAFAVALLLPTVFGADYRASVAPTLVLLASAAPLTVYFLGVPVLLGTGRARLLAVLSVAGALVNVVVDVALIPSLGLWAPTLATLAQNVGVALAMAMVLGAGRGRELFPALPVMAAIGLVAATRTPVTLAALAVVTTSTAVLGARCPGAR